MLTFDVGVWQLTSADRDETKMLLPLLQHIADDHCDPTVQEMATDLRIAIATHGIVLSELARERATDGGSREAKQRVESALRGCESSRSEVKRSAGEVLRGDRSGGERSAPLIEVLSSHDNDDTKTTSDDNSVTAADDVVTTSCDSSVSRNIDAERISKRTHDVSPTHVTGDPTSRTGGASFEKALVELCDSLVPVRGHALITLTRLLQRRDEAALSRVDLLMTIFRENLGHPDTYIYLQAVAGLSALGEVAPDTVLPTLLREYSQGRRSAELTVKLGEAIVRISRCLGQLRFKQSSE